MAKFLLSCLAASIAASAVASPKALTHLKALENGIPEKSVSIRKAALTAQSRIVKGNVNVLKAAEGRSLKQLRRAPISNNVNPLMKKAPATRAGGQSILFEDFEGWDGVDPDWLPEGWSVRHESGYEGAEKWEITSPAGFGGMLPGVTGNSLSINYSTEFLDEWVIFPEVTLGSDMVLSFDAFNDGIWYFSMENVDWDAFEYIGDKVVAYDQQIMISEDDGETWKLLKSLAEDFTDFSLDELYAMSTNAISRVNISLSEYSGKTVRLALRYVGTDGNLGVIDNISIGNPPLSVSYTNPWGALFLGMGKESEVLNASILNGPVFQPMSFENTSYYNEGATYSWDYFGPESTWQTSDSQDYLDVTYRTDYSSPANAVNNLYFMPVLKGTAPGYSEGTFTRGTYLKAGGKGEYLAMGADGSSMLIDLGLTVVDYASERTQTVTDLGMPLFGYDGNVDNYWSQYTFGDAVDKENYVKLDAYMDFFYTSAAPIVIHGIHAPAYGRVKDGVKFKAEIVTLSDEGVISEVPLATAECGLADLTVIDNGGTNNFLSLNFTFAEPVVISSDVCMAYIVRISGFNDPEHVEYFSPILSRENNPDEYALGWIQKTIVMDGNARQSSTAVVNYIEEYIAFYIMLDAEFPWLEGPEIADTWDNMTASVTLDSSYAGADLSFENLPGWLSAKAEGQYGNTIVTFQAAMTDEIKADTEVTVTAPGVSHVITVKAPESNAVGSIETSDAAVEIYNISGLRVADTSAPGIYIIMDAKGRTRKVSK